MVAKIVKISQADMTDFHVLKFINQNIYNKNPYFCRNQKKQRKNIQNEYIVLVVKKLYSV